ncbi:MAG: thymidylate synthase, partial [Pseudomonadales bacterium]
MKQYLEQLQTILDQGTERNDRTGVGTISCFGMQGRYNLSEGFPAVTTKKLVWKSMVSELLWFVSGSGNIHDLKAIYKHNKLWDLNYQDYLTRRGISTD